MPLVGRVIAVEPVAEMRRVLEAAQPSADVRPGTAEAIPLDAASVDAVLVGAAFHWFDAEAALAEIHRVLRPGGGLGLLWNRPEWDAEPWYPGFAAVRERARAAQGGPPNLLLRRRSGGPLSSASPLYGPVRKREFRHVHRVSREEFLARVASWSVFAVLPEDAPIGAARRGRSPARRPWPHRARSALPHRHVPHPRRHQSLSS